MGKIALLLGFLLASCGTLALIEYNRANVAESNNVKLTQTLAATTDQLHWTRVKVQPVSSETVTWAKQQFDYSLDEREKEAKEGKVVRYSVLNETEFPLLEYLVRAAQEKVTAKNEAILTYQRLERYVNSNQLFEEATMTRLRKVYEQLLLVS